MTIIITACSVTALGVVGAKLWGKKDLTASVIGIMGLGLLAHVFGLNGATKWPVGKWNLLAAEETSRILQVGSVEEIFLVTLVIVAIVIFVFANWYMAHDPYLKYFELVIVLFAGAMTLFITSQDLITIVTFWEGIGITSFLLIGFYTTRLEANKAAIKAVVMNKIGDVTLMIIMASIVSFSGVLITGSEPAKGLVIFLLIALAAKSAQFGLHGW